MDTELFAANPELGRTSPDYVIYVPKGTDERFRISATSTFSSFRRKDGHLRRSLDPTRPRRAVQPAHRVRGIRRLGPELERAAHHRRREVRPGNRQRHVQLGISAGQPVGTHLRAVQQAYRRQRRIHAYDRQTGRHLQRRQREKLVGRSIPDFPRSEYDSPDPAMPGNCITWQKPLRFGDGRYLPESRAGSARRARLRRTGTGFTRRAWSISCGSRISTTTRKFRT